MTDTAQPHGSQSTATTRTTSPPVLHVRLLGGFEIGLPDGRTAGPWTRPTARRLVELLLVRPQHRIGREEVAELLFPELAPDRAANAVSKALSMARKGLGEERGPEILKADRSTIWIAPDIELRIDYEIHRERLRDGLETPAGPERDDALVRALDDKGRLLDDELYADWAIEERESLEALRREARLALARDRSAGFGKSDAGSVLAAWSSVFDSDPTSEEAAIALMRTFTARGGRDEAVRTYHRCRAALHGVLDATPSAALDEALADVQNAPVTVHQPVTPRHVVSFGRDEVVEQLHVMLGRTVDGDAPSIEILAPAGMGKTHLLSAVRSRMEETGWTVLYAASLPADRLIPYAAIRTALRPLLHAIPDDTLLGRVMGKAAGSVRPAGAEASDQQSVLAAEIAELLEDAAGSAPLALVLDDCHWMEPATASVTTRLAGRAAPRRWAVLLAARSDEPDAPVPGLGSNVVRIELEPLTGPALAEMIQHRFGKQAMTLGNRLERIATRSGGNPLFALELARAHLRSPELTEPEVPSTITELFRSHLAAATRDARALVPLVALCGDEATFELILDVGASLVGSDSAAMDALDNLISLGLLAEESAGVRLVHPLLREAALASVNAVRRANLHEAVAASLETLGPDDAVVRSGRHHVAAFESARLRKHAEAAVQEGFKAADAAFEVYAEEAALELYRGALDAFESLPAAGRSRWRERAVAAWMRLAAILVRRYEHEDAEQAVTKGIAIAETDQERADLWGKLAAIPYRKGDFAAVVATLERGLATLQETSELVRARVEVQIAWSKLRDGRTEDAADGFRRALPVLEQAGAVKAAFLCLDYLALALEAAGRHDEAVETWRRAQESLAHAEALEAPGSRWSRHTRAHFALHRALRPLLMGDLAAAVRDLEAAVDGYLEIGDRYEISVARGILGAAYQAADDPVAALEQWDAVVACLHGSGHWYHLAGAEASRAAILSRLGRNTEAAAAARLARKIAREDASPRTADEIDDIVSGRTIFLTFNRKGLSAQPMS